MSNHQPDILADILAARKKAVAADKVRVSLGEMERRVVATPKPKNFFKAVVQPGVVTVIAEMKRKSPSAGLIRDPYKPVDIAKAYERAGVSALSILTEPERFEGRIEDILTVHESCPLPILRKDFLFDPYQIIEARACGASAVLLIADMLDAKQTKDLVRVAKQFDLTALVEVFSEKSVEWAVESGSKLIGINTRNLSTLEMIADNVERLSEKIPNGFAIVAESGIKTVDQVRAYKKAGVSTILVGESLLKQDNLELAAKTLVKAGV